MNRKTRRAFAGRTALITGAAGGIGAALAEALHALGARVWLTDLDPARLQATAARLAGHPVALDELPTDAPDRAEAANAQTANAQTANAQTANAQTANAQTTNAQTANAPATCTDAHPTLAASRLDVTDPAAFAATLAHARARHGPLDLLINNAGVGLAGEIRDLTLADWRRALDVNLWGTIHGVHAALPAMIARRRGHIINIASGAALAPRPGMAPYAAAKSAVVALTLALRAEAAPHHVRVNAACPGYIDTGILDRTTYVALDPARLRAAIPIAPLSAPECARRILHGAARDRPIIPVGAEVAAEWRLARYLPRLVDHLARWRARQFGAHRIEG
ncbi:MAG: SDR family NAD(P)-dependent oxidoreductase [Myxococcales bacterium]|nr:SDR family NAD(P)-dependent oxidoreductase [Myxococcales bacterium]